MYKILTYPSASKVRNGFKRSSFMRADFAAGRACYSSTLSSDHHVHQIDIVSHVLENFPYRPNSEVLGLLWACDYRSFLHSMLYFVAGVLCSPTVGDLAGGEYVSPMPEKSASRDDHERLQYRQRLLLASNSVADRLEAAHIFAAEGWIDHCLHDWPAVCIVPYLFPHLLRLTTIKVAVSAVLSMRTTGFLHTDARTSENHWRILASHRLLASCSELTWQADRLRRIAEISAGIVVSCTPLIPSFYQRHLQKALGSVKIKNIGTRLSRPRMRQPGIDSEDQIQMWEHPHMGRVSNQRSDLDRVKGTKDQDKSSESQIDPRP